ncbi:MAG: hypothetical protein DMD30_13120 [Gemmatimonadetes bacterium]|nr:MAG: hypothetical protein DMD30_13120 [Gemmatimonadota bacterium]
MLNAPCYIVSDAHLGVASKQIERSFVSFLRGLAGEARALIINGDLFDFWFEWKTVIPRRSFRALAALAELSDVGVEILWVAGNHDCWGGEILREDVGVSYVVGAWEGTVAEWQVRIEHGDGLREREDRGYRMIRPIMRNRLAIKAFRMLHPDWASRLAQGSWTRAPQLRAATTGGRERSGPARLRTLARSGARAYAKRRCFCERGILARRAYVSQIDRRSDRVATVERFSREYVSQLDQSVIRGNAGRVTEKYPAHRRR